MSTTFKAGEKFFGVFVGGGVGHVQTMPLIWRLKEQF